MGGGVRSEAGVDDEDRVGCWSAGAGARAAAVVCGEVLSAEGCLSGPGRARAAHPGWGTRLHPQTRAGRQGLLCRPRTVGS